MLGSQRRAGRPASHAQRQSRPSHHDSLDLPPYEAPKCPLADDHMRQLKDFCMGRINDAYEKQLAQAAKLLSQSVYAINERVTNRRTTAAKRKRRGDDAEGDAEKAEGEARELEAQALDLATQVEKAMREVLDMQAAVEDEKSTLRDLPALVAGRQQAVAEEARQQQADDGEGDNNADPPGVPGVPLAEVFGEACRAKKAEYERLTPYDKYAINNSYIDFRQSWHEGLYRDPDDIPLPDATKWFDRDGRPRLEARRGEGVGGGEAAGADANVDEGEDDEDDEIQIAREKRSLRCPLSLAVIREPYTCKLCKHSFEKSAITEYIQGGPSGRGKAAECPVSGCHVQAMTLQDLFFDEALLRRIKRAEQAEMEAEARSSDQEDGIDMTVGDDDDDDSRVGRASRASMAKRLKTEPCRNEEVEVEADDHGDGSA